MKGGRRVAFRRRRSMPQGAQVRTTRSHQSAERESPNATPPRASSPSPAPSRRAGCGGSRSEGILERRQGGWDDGVLLGRLVHHKSHDNREEHGGGGGREGGGDGKGRLIIRHAPLCLKMSLAQTHLLPVAPSGSTCLLWLGIGSRSAIWSASVVAQAPTRARLSWIPSSIPGQAGFSR